MSTEKEGGGVGGLVPACCELVPEHDCGQWGPLRPSRPCRSPAMPLIFLSLADAEAFGGWMVFSTFFILSSFLCISLVS